MARSLGVVVLLAQRFSHVTGDDGSHIRLFQPDTWSSLRWALVAIDAVRAAWREDRTA